MNANGGFSFNETAGTGPGGPTPPGAYTFTYVENYGGCSLSLQQKFTVTLTTWAYQAGKYAGKSGTVSVVSYPEPNSLKYVNYCGPAASRVLISGWTKNVPSLSRLAREEHTVASGPNAGTLATNMPGPINKAIGTGYYGDQRKATTQAIFSNRIGYDIAHGHPLITALMTGVPTGTGKQLWLNGWDYSKLQVPHIVTIYGFDFTSPTQGKIYYMETAGTVSGTDETGPQEIDYQEFWTLVQANNVQLAGSSG